MERSERLLLVEVVEVSVSFPSWFILVSIGGPCGGGGGISFFLEIGTTRVCLTTVFEFEVVATLLELSADVVFECVSLENTDFCAVFLGGFTFGSWADDLEVDGDCLAASA